MPETAGERRGDSGDATLYIWARGREEGVVFWRVGGKDLARMREEWSEHPHRPKVQVRRKKMENQIGRGTAYSLGDLRQIVGKTRKMARYY